LPETWLRVRYFTASGGGIPSNTAIEVRGDGSAESVTVGSSAPWTARQFLYRVTSIASNLSFRSLTGGIAGGRVDSVSVENAAPFVNGSFEDDRFTQRSLELATGWQPSGASRLEARIGSGQTQYPRGGDRDFDNVSGSLNWTWRPTGKLTAYTGLSRERGQDNYPTFVRVPAGFFLVDLPAVQANLRTIETLRGQLDWAASAKVGVSASLQYARRDVSVRTRTVLDDVLRGSAEGIDQTTIVSLGARWSAMRWAQLGCDLRHEKRRATGNVTDGLTGTSLSCSAQATLR
jgi:hypothetical protein